MLCIFRNSFESSKSKIYDFRKLKTSHFKYKYSNLKSIILLGLRLDGRKPDELRQIKTRLGVFAQADGSAYIEQVGMTFRTIEKL